MSSQRASLRFSRYAALGLGIFLIAIETWRRSHQLRDLTMWPAIFDDYLGGAFLITASLIASRTTTKGRTWLAAAWGGATAMMFGSFFGQLAEHARGELEPGIGQTNACVLDLKAGARLQGAHGLVALVVGGHADDHVDAGADRRRVAIAGSVL